MTWLKILFSYVLCIVIVVATQNKDDYEYDYGSYEDIFTNGLEETDEEDNNIMRDSFPGDIFDVFGEELRDMYFSSNPDVSKNNIDSFNMEDTFGERFDSNKSPKKIYRYTKYRNLQHVEFDYTRYKDIQECDDKSIWTRCLCQFTCSKLDMVDCYTPCKSGCECKKEYVLDEKTQKCVLPEQCSSGDIHVIQT